jgi:hypothetical protein
MSDHTRSGFHARELAAVTAALDGYLNRDRGAATLYAMMLWRRRAGGLATLPA